MIDDHSNRLTWIACGMALIFVTYGIFNEKIPQIIGDVTTSIQHVRDVKHIAYAFNSDGTKGFSKNRLNKNILTSNSLSDWKTATTSSWDSNDENTFYSLDSHGLKAGDTITYQEEIDATNLSQGTSITLEIQYFQNNKWLSNIQAKLDNASKIHTVTTKIPSGIDEIRLPYFSKDNKTTTDTLKIRHRKLEIGENATTWSPESSNDDNLNYSKYIGFYYDSQNESSDNPRQYEWRALN